MYNFLYVDLPKITIDFRAGMWYNVSKKTEYGLPCTIKHGYFKSNTY